MARRTGIGLAVVAAAASVIFAASASAVTYEHDPESAGYFVRSTKITSISGRFTIPTITCTGNATGVGPGIFATDTYKKGRITYAGLVGAGIITACQSGQPTYQIATVISPKEENTAYPMPGDLMFVQIHLSTKGASITIKDLTRPTLHETQSGTGGVSSGVTVGTASVSQNNVLLGIHKFTPMVFTDSLVNGRSLAWWKAAPVEMWGPPKHPTHLEIKPTPLTDHGEAFKMNFVSN